MSVIGNALRRWAGALALGLALAGGLAGVAAAAKATTPQERAKFVSITRGLEAEPFRASARKDREWAVKWISEAPDVSVDICADVVEVVLNSKFEFGPELTGQYMFAVGSAVIEHPDSSVEAQQLAGLESVVKTYQAMVQAKPASRTADLDGLVKVQADGKLPDYVHTAYAACAKKG